MVIRLWHVEPLQTSERNMELPEWPYSISEYGPAPVDLTNFLQNLGVVRLEVEGKVNKLIIPVPKFSKFITRGQWPNKWAGPWECYTSFGDFNPDTLEINTWKVPSNTDYYRRFVGDSMPDNFCWFEWNKRNMVKAMDSSGVYYG